MSHWRKLNSPSFSKPVPHDGNHTGPASGLQQAIHNPEAAVEPLVIEMQPFRERAKGEHLEESRGKTEKTAWGYCWTTGRSGVIKKEQAFRELCRGQGRGQAGIVWDTAQGSQHPLLSQHCSDSRDKPAVMALPLQNTFVLPNRAIITGEEKEDTNSFNDNTKNTVASWSALVLTS